MHIVRVKVFGGSKYRSISVEHAFSQPSVPVAARFGVGKQIAVERGTGEEYTE